VADARAAPRPPHTPSPAADTADPLVRLLAAAAADPATDERTRTWLNHLLTGDSADAERGGAER
jgi:hypothetical protein